MQTIIRSAEQANTIVDVRDAGAAVGQGGSKKVEGNGNL